MVVRECVIASNHASLAGHFPGNPVVPGVVILDEVISVFEQYFPEADCVGFSMVKFNSVLLPEEKFVITLEEVGATKLKFACTHLQKDDGKMIASGQMQIAANIPGS